MDDLTTTQTLVSTHRIRIGDILKWVTVHIWQAEDGHLSVSASHQMQTPIHTNPYIADPRYPHQQTPEGALRTVIAGFECSYLEGKEADQTPDDSWWVSA